MGNFHRGNRQGDDRGSKNFGSRSSHMYPATCNTCGKACEVPFRPAGNRPTYCSDCFKKQGNKSGVGRERNFDRPRFQDRRRPGSHSDDIAGNRDLEQVKAQLEQVNAKLDAILRTIQPGRLAAEAQKDDVDVEIEDRNDRVPVSRKEPKKAKGKKKK